MTDTELTTRAVVDWDSPRWGVAGHNVHEASWAADGRHDDTTDEETCQ